MIRDRRKALEHFMRHPVTDAVVMLLIVLSVVLLVMSFSLAPDHRWTLTVERLSYAITLAFGIELTLRWFAERRKRKFWERYWLDCLAVLPAFRWFRFLWLLRLLRLFRFGLLLSRRMSGYSALARHGATEAAVGTVIVIGLVIAGAVGVRASEGAALGFDDFGESLWWSVLSLVAAEPIGQTPETSAGRLVTLGVMLSGLVVFAVVTGVVSANMVDRLRKLNLRDMEIEDLEDHVVICGWSPTAVRVLRELQSDADYGRRGIVVIAEFDREPVLSEQLPMPALVFFMGGDYTRPDVLHRARISEASRAIVLADRTIERSDQDRDARSVLTALLIENINLAHDKDIFTSVELVNRDNAQSLISAGVEEIVVATDYVGRILASSSRQVGMTPILDELLTAQYGNQFYKFVTPQQMPRRTVAELRTLLHDRAHATLLAIEAESDQGPIFRVNPPDDASICGGQIVVVIAERAVDPSAVL